MNFDLYKDSFGKDKNGKEIFMKDIWPTNKEIEETLKSSLSADMFVKDIQMFQKVKAMATNKN